MITHIIENERQVLLWRHRRIRCSKCGIIIPIHIGHVFYSNTAKPKNRLFYCKDCYSIMYVDVPDDEGEEEKG